MVRLWEEDPEPYLTDGLRLLPLAPRIDVPQAGLPALIDRMAERIGREPKPKSRAEGLWAATCRLMGCDTGRSWRRSC